VIENIVNKTAVINDIVFKTQLLSFNASIEAARAGIHGRGFAVVAEEVGNLAELSGAAAKEIESLLGDSQRKVKDTLEVIQDRVADGNRVSQSALHVFEEISKNIEEINVQIKGIGEATQQQEIGIQQTNTAMKQMDVSSQSNTDAASRAQSTSNQLKNNCHSLDRVVQEIYFLVNGRVEDRKSGELEVKEVKRGSVVDREESQDDLESLVNEIASKSVQWTKEPHSTETEGLEVVDRSLFKKVI
jgi:methyl-accepting chemotaxis protein